ncbi:unnamed protein product, partial [marine sediment metagenome]
LQEKYNNLKILDASRNKKITSKGIQCLIQLYALNLSYNDLTSLPDIICNLSSLQRLNISHNKLTSLPDSISNLSSLQYLDISYNNFTSVPDIIYNSSSLRFLNITNNGLTSLPELCKKSKFNCIIMYSSPKYYYPSDGLDGLCYSN